MEGPDNITFSFLIYIPYGHRVFLYMYFYTVVCFFMLNIFVNICPVILGTLYLKPFFKGASTSILSMYHYYLTSPQSPAIIMLPCTYMCTNLSLDFCFPDTDSRQCSFCFIGSRSSTACCLQLRVLESP